MQDRYAGDIGDYGKFALLRTLAAKGLSIGVNWYLVETPPQELAVNDGGKLIPNGLAACDPELAEVLRGISRRPERSVRSLEKACLVPGARYFAYVVPVDGRAAWHDRALSALAGADLVFLDPPRAGSDERFLSSLLRCAPKKVVYVSCDPETLARDLGTLTKGGYRVGKIQPVDMFPYTRHIECVCQLFKEGAK